MKDTIGARLIASIEAAALAQYLHMQYDLIRHRSVGMSYRASLRIAQAEGAAAGHAFRAAELAYDMGQKHGLCLGV